MLDIRNCKKMKKQGKLNENNEKKVTGTPVKTRDVHILYNLSAWSFSSPTSCPLQRTLLLNSVLTEWLGLLLCCVFLWSHFFFTKHVLGFIYIAVYTNSLFFLLLSSKAVYGHAMLCFCVHLYSASVFSHGYLGGF